MARTKGAKDRTKRKQPAEKAPPKTPMRPAAKTSPETAPSIGGERSPERPAIPPDEFKAAIAAELGKATNQAQVTPGQDATQGTNRPAETLAPAADFDPAALTIDGLANAWRVPFYALARLLAWLRVAPDPEPIEAVGRRHAKTMAKASFPIWDYYARQYVNVHPDQAVNVSIGVTALDGIGIVPDLIDAIGESRRRAARAVSSTPQPAAGPGGPAPTSQPAGTAG